VRAHIKVVRAHIKVVRARIKVLDRNTNGEVNICHENTTMVVWIYDGINSKK
jgi:hypothetical protein